MTKFHCTLCGYSTEREKIPERCPYCSKLGSMEQEESAEELVVEA